ncbi:hypothetical protein [Streptomyces sp. NBC_00576]|uniref:hypothetical protein n=1 Tax=Streptomyces sp. NBC_00576 TaxID=2903665 RepID=UPI003FCDB0B5
MASSVPTLKARIEKHEPGQQGAGADQGDDVAPVAHQHAGQHDQEGHAGDLHWGGVPGHGGVGGVVAQDEPDGERHQLQDRYGAHEGRDVEGDPAAAGRFATAASSRIPKRQTRISVEHY